MRKILVLIVISALLACAAASAGASGYVYFTGDCNVRTGPGLNYGTLGAMSAGSQLTYTGRSSYDNRGVEWYNVYYRGGEGWVSSVYARLQGSSPYPSYGRKVVAVSGDTNIRSQPSLYGAELGVLYRGNSLSYADDYSIDYRGVTWYCVWWGGQKAWVSSVYTSLVG